MSNENPTPEEFTVLIFRGRIERLMREKNLSYVNALKEAVKGESPEEYAARNQRALQEVIAQLDSPEYFRRAMECMSDPDPISREAKRAKLREDNCNNLDLEALHRHVRDNQKRLEDSGVVPRTIWSIEDLPENSLQLPDAECPNCHRTKTTWCGQERSFTFWFCDYCGNSYTERVGTKRE